MDCLGWIVAVLESRKGNSVFTPLRLPLFVLFSFSSPTMPLLAAVDGPQPALHALGPVLRLPPPAGHLLPAVGYALCKVYAWGIGTSA